MTSAKQQFLDTYEREHGTTMRLLRAYPADKLELRPAAMSKTARELAWVFALERRLGALEVAFDEQTFGRTLAHEVRSLRAGLDEARITIAALPIPPRAEFTCSCGNSGWIAAHVRCTVCGRDSTWGFHPKSS